MLELGYSDSQRFAIVTQLTAAGLWEDNNNNNNDSSTLQAVTKDFLDSAATISTILIQDFGLSPIAAHQTRAALQRLIGMNTNNSEGGSTEDTTRVTETQASVPLLPLNKSGHALQSRPDLGTSSLEESYKSMIVSKAAQRRAAAVHSSLEYGLPRHYEAAFPVTAAELDDFFAFMTVPSTDSQGETPIRAATANIYLRHAKLFLGWYWDFYLPEHEEESDDIDTSNKENLSLYKIFPTKEKEHASSILEFLLWLRSTRQIAVSYEANLLRGLSKLLKFRFRKESSDQDRSSSNDNSSSFGDIPLIRELRKLHRDANRRQAVAPRVSNEDCKWLAWPDYLQVVQCARKDVSALIEEFDAEYSQSQDETTDELIAKGSHRSHCRQVQERRVAVALQKYLILAFFANVPDRQRTIRELEIGRSFVKDVQNNQWCIKHAPEDYKTGKTYGERPPLHLPVALTSEIDEFIARWRPILTTKSDRVGNNNHLFLQVRTGNPLSSDSVYHSVSKTCYSYTGKRTNPHLLRDMIVTHVRESSDATEKQLEALALFMGHSSAVQRKSYDRRTLTKKVAPAVALMEKVNADGLSRQWTK